VIEEKIYLEDCHFIANESNYIGSAINSGGGGMYIRDSQTDVNNCKFSRNIAKGINAGLGGGIAINSGLMTEITQSIFEGNRADAFGGGLYSDTIGTSANYIYIINSVFANNYSELQGSAGPGAGIRIDDDGDTQLQIENSILWGNRSNGMTEDVHTLWNQIFSNHSHPSVMNSNIEKGDVVYGDYHHYMGYGNIFEDPKMVNASAGDVRLGADSPCIDSGNSYVDFEPITTGFTFLPDTDPAGNPRITDGNDDGIAEVDIGVYEYQP